MSLYHTVLVAKIEGALAGKLAQPCSSSRVIQKAAKGGGKVRGVSRMKSHSSAIEDFDESAEIGRHNRQAAKHVLRKDQAENFSAKRWNDDGRSLREGEFKGFPVEAAGKTNLAGDFRVAGGFLQISAIRARTGYQQIQ